MIETDGAGAANGVPGWFGLPSDLFAYGTDSPAYLFWQSMQSIANVVMIIVLLVVIFSQLTGFGIDNYGIKKILPKLIIAALLINLSFGLCQAAVDLSNVLGKGLMGMTDTIIERVRNNTDMPFLYGARNVFAGLFTALFTAMAGGAAAGGTIASAITLAGAGSISLGAISAPWWIIPLVLLALTAIVAVGIFFLMLALRKLLAVLLVIIAPLAIVCYVLPNTQGLFKKWLKLFETILVLYPVCAGLYGISQILLVVTMRAEGTDFLMVMVGLLLSFLPLFAAPKILKSAMAGFGNIGAVLSGIGERAKAGVRSADSAIKQSEAYKDATREGLAARNKRFQEKFERMQKRSNDPALSEKRRSRANNYVARNERAYARRSASVDKYNEELVAGRIAAMRGETGNYDNSIMSDKLNELLNKGDKMEESDKLYAGALMTKLAGQSGGEKKLFEAINGKTGAAARYVGEYMARDATVKRALEKKSRRAAARLGDIASGVVDKNIEQADYDKLYNGYLVHRRKAKAAGNVLSDNIVEDQEKWIKEQEESAFKQARAARKTSIPFFDDWKKEQEKNGESIIDRTTVIENIARNVLDKDKDFVTQSGGEVKELVKHVTDERINRMAANQTLFSMGDVADGVRETIESNVTHVYSYRGDQVKVRDVRIDSDGNMTAGVMKINGKWRKPEEEGLGVGRWNLKDYVKVS